MNQLSFLDGPREELRACPGRPEALRKVSYRAPEPVFPDQRTPMLSAVFRLPGRNRAEQTRDCHRR